MVASKCIPSQTGKDEEQKFLYVCIHKKSGEILFCRCTCRAGNSEICTHVGGLLFLIAEKIASGVESLNEDEVSCTDKRCEWIQQRSAKVVPVPAEDIPLSEKDKKRMKPTARSYGPYITKVKLDKEVDYNRTLELHTMGSAACPDCALVKGLDLMKFRPETKEEDMQYFEQLPDMFVGEDVAFSLELSVEDIPLPIAEFTVEKMSPDDVRFGQTVTDLFARISEPMSQVDITKIDSATAGQASNPEWFRQRKGAVTASKIHRVLSSKV